VNAQEQENKSAKATYSSTINCFVCILVNSKRERERDSRRKGKVITKAIKCNQTDNRENFAGVKRLTCNEEERNIIAHQTFRHSTFIT